MSIPAVSQNLDGWTIEVLDSLLNIPTVESETFDFKGSKLNDLDVHICAMANTAGGILVLGIDENKTGDHLLGFKKKGFGPEEEEDVKGKIRNYTYNVDPMPQVNTKSLKDNDGRIYLVVRVDGEEIKKPYFLKNKGICYVRVGDSSSPATRTVIINLFSDLRQTLKNVEMLRRTAMILIQDLHQVSQDIKDAIGDHGIISPVDLTFIKASALECEHFLSEYNLLTKRSSTGSVSTGIEYYFSKIAKLNELVALYNNERNRGDKDGIRLAMDNWTPGRNEIRDVILFFERLGSDAKKFLESKRA